MGAGVQATGSGRLPEEALGLAVTPQARRAQHAGSVPVGPVPSIPSLSPHCS